VQHQLNCHSRDPSRLVPCFKAAHRSDIDSTAEDGNCTLAKFGVKIMEMVEKHCSSVLERIHAVGSEHASRRPTGLTSGCGTLA
jgi:hypothetical protein